MFFIMSFTENLCRPSDVHCKFSWAFQRRRYAAWHEGNVACSSALISFLSETIKAYKREETFSPPCLSLSDERLRGKKKPHTCQNACSSLFPLLCAKSRSELIKTEKELACRDCEREQQKLVSSAWGRRTALPGPRYTLPHTGHSVAPQHLWDRQACEDRKCLELYFLKPRHRQALSW